MKAFDRRLAAALLAPGLLLLAFGLGGGGALWATLEPAERATLLGVLQTRGMLLVAIGLGLWALAAALVAKAYRRHVLAAAQLAEQAQVRVDGEPKQPLAAADGSTALQALAGSIDALVRQRGALRDEMAARVAEAARHVADERNRLAALMAELTQAVVVCNLDGRILLYNERARAQFRALSAAPAVAAGAELIGLGRSIYGVFERRLVAHALEQIRQQLQRSGVHPSTQFVTSTAAGQLLRAVMTPVRPADDEQAIHGFVLLLDNITREFEQDSVRDAQLHAFTEGTRSSLGNLQAAVEMLEMPDLEPAMRERFQAVVRDEVHAMGERVQALAARGAQELRTRWPLEDVLGADLVAAAARRIEAQGLQVATDAVDRRLWLKVDSFSLLLALASLAARLHEGYEVARVELRLATAGSSGTRAHLDLLWVGPAMSTETVIGWETEPMRVGADASPLSLRDVVQRHGAELWFERERARHASFFRFLLPLAGEQPPLDAATFVHGDSRPEFYDFDLFAQTESSRALDERALTELSYTVFDTETTGLNPSQGDEIIQLGATRIVAGKLRRQECFEQLVDPQRDIPAAGIPIHGIEPAMVRGQPTIDAVLPAFHAFARDTVLVGHNAAFDMRFLQLKEQRSGVRFDQPVLDTLLLAAVAQPNQDGHALETLAERLGVTVMGRHTALGDAIVTAEVFLKLIPLLQAQGIHTLGQARAAAQQTLYARLQY